MKEMVYMERRQQNYTMLDEDIYKGFHYAIVSLGSHPCAYVELPEHHKYYGKDYDEIPIECHGGLTYSSSDGIASRNSPLRRDGFWIGWDYAHLNDYVYRIFDHGKRWSTEEILVEVMYVIDQLNNVQ